MTQTLRYHRHAILGEGEDRGEGSLPLLAVSDGACSSVNEVCQGVDDHQRPHCHAGPHVVTLAAVLVGVDGHGTASDVHDGGSEAVQNFQQVRSVCEEDVSKQQREGDKD